MSNKKIILLLAGLCPALTLLPVSVARAAPLTGAKRHDYDGDGKADLAVYHSELGNWYIQRSSNGSSLAQNLGWSEARPVCGDFDGDGKEDPAVFNRQTGTWYIRQSSNNALRTAAFGQVDGRPVVADYDGDGKSDLAVWQRYSGNWYIQRSSDNGIQVINWGWSETRPVAGADFDGDGKSDIVVWHRATGNWYIRFSSGGSWAGNFGWSQTRPVAADYDGDGKTDVAVYHLASGNWYVRYSSNNQVAVRNWGWIAARATPGDFDGDNKADFAVYHRSAGNWYILNSSNQTSRIQNYGWSKAGALPSYRDGAIQNLVILCMGDSITYGTSSSSGGPATGYPILMERLSEPGLGGHCVTINGGDPGESTSEGKTRLLTLLATYKPDLTIIMEGTNDMFFQEPFSKVDSNLRTMVSYALAYGSSAIISTIPPVIKSEYRDRTAQEQRIEAFNPRIYQIAADFRIPLADTWRAITSQPNWQKALMDQETANHPNDAGYKIVARNYYSVLEGATLSGQFY